MSEVSAFSNRQVDESKQEGGPILTLIPTLEEKYFIKK